ncbi:hypothetical protein D3C79_1015230 [compost metagenome]
MHVQACAMFLQPSHGTRGRVQAPGAAAGEHDGVHLFDQIRGMQQVGFTRAGSGAAHIDAAHRTRARQDHGAARGAPRVTVVADFNALHAGDAAGVAAFGER